MALHVIFPAPRLNAQDIARAVAAGPQWAATSVGYSVLLDEAGFVDIEESDITAQFRETAAAWLHESIASAADLKSLFGAEDYLRGVEERRNVLAAIDGGLLRRAVFTARAGASCSGPI
jgi:hypothetical protein